MNAEDTAESEAALRGQMQDYWAKLVDQAGEEGARAKLAAAKAKAESTSPGQILLTGLLETLRTWQQHGLLRKLDPSKVQRAIGKMEMALSMGPLGEREGFNTIYDAVTEEVGGTCLLQLLGEKSPEALVRGMLALQLGTPEQCQATADQLRTDRNDAAVLGQLHHIIFTPIMPLYGLRQAGMPMTTEQYFANASFGGAMAMNMIEQLARPPAP